MALFSKRNDKPKDRYTYEISEKVRSRLFHSLNQHQFVQRLGQYDFSNVLHEVRDKLFLKYGFLAELKAGQRSAGDGVIDHFRACSSEQVIDFLLFCFESRELGATGDIARAVDAVNKIFEEESIGFEFTHPQEVDAGPGRIDGRLTGGRSFRIIHPKAVRKDEAVVHDKAVKPALDVLADSRFVTANSEMMKAFEEIQRGEYADAITSCGSAFESVLKTICDAKSWAYDPQRHTCSDLVGVCQTNGLFPSFYTEMFKGIGSVRNKIGDAHGRGPRPTVTASREHAEHMIAATCSHIVFLVRLANL